MANEQIATPVRDAKRPRTWAFRAEARALAYAQRVAAEEAEHVAWMDQMPEAFGVCYFIGSDAGLVKIGFSHNVSRRLAELRATTPFRLTLLATARGGRQREMHYHRRFKSDCAFGEWFNLTAALKAEIAHLRPTPSEGEEG